MQLFDIVKIRRVLLGIFLVALAQSPVFGFAADPPA